MPAFYRAPLPEFLAASDSELLGILTLAHAEEGFAHQLKDATKTWFADTARLREQLAILNREKPQTSEWTVLLEFVIPRKRKRIDVVLLTSDAIVLMEQKSGRLSIDDCLQAEEYALLLHYFHRPSDRRTIVPIVVSPQAEGGPPNRQQELAFGETAAYWISPVRMVRWNQVAQTLSEYARREPVQDRIDPTAWDQGDYFPVPSIIEAARTLREGLSIREIAHSRAAKHDISNLTEVVKKCVEEACSRKQFIICFVTGVPGSGKTLVGLNLAFSSRADQHTLSFMSGNGPLVDVLQALFADYRQRVEGYRRLDAKHHAETLIEDVHLFAKTYTQVTPDAIPSNHVVVFDEAQRAWNREHSKRKFGREYSEPEMFLRIMERHPDWAVIVALVGGGQEINDGEAGLAEWGIALSQTRRRWSIVASPDVISGGDSVAGEGLLSKVGDGALSVQQDPRLHLTVSVRSLKAENYSKWVNCVVDGQREEAAKLNTGDFPVFITRSLECVRQSLRNQTVGYSRSGLVGSSKATRLRAEGLEPDGTFHGDYRWDRWYLAPASDVRCSSQLEVFATKFEIQGLELDWIGLCWGGDFVWSASTNKWVTRKFRNASVSGWSSLRMPTQQMYRRNSYRVLLTRARQGLIIYVPLGEVDDPTRDPKEFEETSQFLIACGVRPLEDMVPAQPVVTVPTLFDTH